MIIGNITYSKAQDTYTGELATLTVAARKVVFQPSEARGDKAPSHRVVSPGKTGNVELGAAWKTRSEEGRDYLSVKLDDPSLAQPLNCALVESGERGAFAPRARRGRSLGAAAADQRLGRPPRPYRRKLFAAAAYAASSRGSSRNARPSYTRTCCRRPTS